MNIKLINKLNMNTNLVISKLFWTPIKKMYQKNI